MSDYSENEDDPDVYESSGDEWEEEAEEKKRNKRRMSQRLSKKPRVTLEESTDSDEDDEDIPVNGVNRKTKKPFIKVTPTPINKTTTNTTTITTTTTTTPTTTTTTTTTTFPEKQKSAPFERTYTTGTFVISKKDALQGSPSNPPSIWKIDGKALLQKFEPFEEDGKIRYQNTSIYTGWSSIDRDNYASIHVRLYFHSGQKMILEIDWDQLKTITIDSD